MVRVEISYASEKEQLSFVIVPDDQADFSAGFLGESTPLAQAIMGEKVKAEIPYFAGDARSVQILEIEQTNITPSPEIAERREQKMRDALQQVEKTNAVIFALVFQRQVGRL